MALLIAFSFRRRSVSRFLRGGNSSKFTCHPRAQRTLRFLCQHFCWQGLVRDVSEFVAACVVCARSKASHRPPAGLLLPLSIPSRPLSHIAVDFATGLPPSNGHTVILTIVDHFSKMVHYILLAKPLSATETADPLALHVFRLHGLSAEIVSDQGPQFTSQVWQTFCRAFGTTCSLTSGYHLQSNRQTERANQDLETTLPCVTAHNPSFRSSSLSWMEYGWGGQNNQPLCCSPKVACIPTGQGRRTHGGCGCFLPSLPLPLLLLLQTWHWLRVWPVDDWLFCLKSRLSCCVRFIAQLVLRRQELAKFVVDASLL